MDGIFAQEITSGKFYEKNTVCTLISQNEIIMHAIKVAFQNVREQLTPVLQESAFLEKGVLTVSSLLERVPMLTIDHPLCVDCGFLSTSFSPSHIHGT